MDYDLQEIKRRGELACADFPGSQVFYKFTCAHCGSRQTFERPNTLYTSGICEECGSTTDPIKGYGFDLYISQK